MLWPLGPLVLLAMGGMRVGFSDNLSEERLVRRLKMVCGRRTEKGYD